MYIKKSIKWQLLLVALLLFISSNLFAQKNYRNHDELTKALKSIQNEHPSNAKLKSLTKTVGGFDIWALTLSNGNASNNPAIAIVGGVDGSHLLGSEMAVEMAENILKNHKEALATTTFYIFPNMSPNASENYFSKLKHEAKGNAKSTDNDRDGKFNEDPFEDLNADGNITLMRIEDLTGNYISLEEDPRIMVKADKNKGEIGTHKIFSEGIDNDKDTSFNEDGAGGIHFNKNLSYNFKYFTSGSGEHPVSEKEHRALLDFLYEQWNLYAILTLGPSNNLSTPLKHNKSAASKRVVTSVLKKDAELNKYLSKRYNEITQTKNAPAATGKGGGFFEWSYFHFGKLAMGTPGWWVPKFEGDSINKPSKNTKVNFLKWAKQEQLENYFIDWTEVEHPDFPGKKVEVGGIAPYLMNNPPYEFIEEISKKHTDFILEIAKSQAEITLQNISSKRINNGLTRITVAIHNKGLLPTHTEMGGKSRWLRKIKVALTLKPGQEIISGRKIELINSIDGDSSKQLTWLIKGNGTVEIEAGAAHTGTDKATIKLN